MAKTTINFEYEGKEYRLWFTPEALRRLEKNGFSFGDIEAHLLSATEDLFIAAFNAEHREVPIKLRKEIFKSLSEQGEDECNDLSEILFDMVAECIDTMKPQGNVKWRVTRG